MDSLQKVLHEAKHDTTRIKVLFELAEKTPDEKLWPVYNQQGMDLAGKYLESPDTSIRYYALKGYASGLNNKGFLFDSKGQYDSAFYNYMRAKDLMLKAKEKRGAAIVLMNLGMILFNKGDYVSALDYSYKSASLFEGVKDQPGIAQTYNNIGSIFNYLGNVKKGFEFFYKSLEIKKQMGNKFLVANGYNNLATVYDKKHMPDSALHYYYKCLGLRNELNEVMGKVQIYCNLGGYYVSLNKVDSARYYLDKSFTLASTLKDPEALAQIYLNYGKLYIQTKEYKKAEEDLLKGLEISKANNGMRTIIYFYSDLSHLYDAQKNFTKAYSYYKISKKLSDSIFNRDSERAVAILQIKNDYEKEQYADSLKRSKIELEKELVHEKQMNRQRSFTYTGVAGFIIMMLMALLFYNRYRIKQRTNLLLEEKNHIILSQKDKVEHQKEVIEGKNKEIVDSINYAQRIQKALLASDKLLSKGLPEYFVLFKPKDIVSGDFYWATPAGDNFIIITADCTGHGVPGAFMSLLNISKIAETIKEKKITAPDKILNFLREEIILALNPEGSTEESQDGMDCVVVSLNKKLTQLEYSAANNSFYIVRDKQLLVCKADNMPVGRSPKEKDFFSYNSVELKKGDVIYTLTDGYADQFGGPKGKKFKYKQLEELLISVSGLSMEEQKQILERRFADWKGNLEQVDDVLIMGIRV